MPRASLPLICILINDSVRFKFKLDINKYLYIQQKTTAQRGHYSISVPGASNVIKQTASSRKNVRGVVACFCLYKIANFLHSIARQGSQLLKQLFRWFIAPKDNEIGCEMYGKKSIITGHSFKSMSSQYLISILTYVSGTGV